MSGQPSGLSIGAKDDGTFVIAIRDDMGSTMSLAMSVDEAFHVIQTFLNIIAGVAIQKWEKPTRTKPGLIVPGPGFLPPDLLGPNHRT